MSAEYDDAILAEILRHNEGRKKALVRLKLSRMALGVFAFFRGSNELFAREWPSLAPLGPGPFVLLCGDLHLENLGAYLTDSGEARFAINDFDEAYVAPASVDLVRCGASILLAAEEWGLAVTTAAAMAVEFLDRYREELAALVVAGRLGDPEPAEGDDAIRSLLLPTAFASRDAMIDRLTRPGKRKGHRVILTDTDHRPVGPKRRKELGDAFAELAESSEPHSGIELLDVSTRVAGLGSLGMRRYLVLVRGGPTGDRMRLLDVKEAAPPVLRACIDAPQPSWGEGEADRVVGAERIVLGVPESGLATMQVDGRSCRVREMVPEANRSKLSRLRHEPARLRHAVRAAGGIAARAHARGAQALDSERGAELSRWATGPDFDSILVASARAADRSRAMFDSFRATIRRKSVRKALGLPPEAVIVAGDGRAR